MPETIVFEHRLIDGEFVNVPVATAGEPAPPTVQDIKAEAQRRIIRITGAVDFSDCLVKQLNASMRATELVNKKVGGGVLTDQETAEAAALQGLADKIKAVRAASNALELSLPSDYHGDVHWPANT